MSLTREFSEPCAPLKESHPIYFSSSASPGIAYIRMISKNQNAYGTLGHSQDYIFFIIIGMIEFSLKLICECLSKKIYSKSF